MKYSSGIGTAPSCESQRLQRIKLIAALPDARRALAEAVRPHERGACCIPTSLPGGAEGGDSDGEARAFVDFLAAAGQSWWQMLPVGPTGYGNSPYSAQSAFAGNPALISRRSPGRGRPADRPAIAASRTTQMLRGGVRGVSRTAAATRLPALSPARPAGWLDDFALYRALKRAHGEVQWTPLAGELRDRDPRALAGARATLADEIAFVRFEQWRFARDWRAAARLRARARHRADRRHPDLRGARQRRRLARTASCSTWTRAGEPALVAGVPPDYFSATGQRWGNPLYRWDRMREDRLRLVDRALPRHARGLRRRPAGPLHRLRPLLGDPGPRADRRSTGAGGAGPGAHFFEAVRRALGASCRSSPRTWASVTPEVKALRDGSACPASGSCSSRSAPIPSARFLAAQLPAQRRRLHRHARQRHDRGLVPRPGQRQPQPRNRRRRNAAAALALPRRDPDADVDRARDPLGDDPHGPDVGRRTSRSCRSQDLLGLGSEARMNRPGTDRGNWALRLAPGALTPAIADRLRGRCASPTTA